MGVQEKMLPRQVSGLGSYREELSGVAPKVEQEGQAYSGEVPLPRVGLSAPPVPRRFERSELLWREAGFQ